MDNGFGPWRKREGGLVTTVSEHHTIMHYRSKMGAFTLAITLAAAVGCADDGSPNRPEDQKTSGGSAGKTATNAGATSRGGGGAAAVGGATSVGSGGLTPSAGQTQTTSVAGQDNASAGNAGLGGAAEEGGATGSGGVVVTTAGTTSVATGGRAATGGATASAGAAGRLATGGAVATGGASAAAGSAGKAATGGAVATGGALATGGASATGGKTSTGGAPSTGGTAAATGGALGLGGFLGLGGAPTSAASCVVYVKGDSGDDFNEGSSWTDAKKTLQAGIDKADQQGGCDVWVAQGIYKPTTSTVRTVSIILRANLHVYGGFLGTETSFAQRDFATNTTTLSGDIGTVGTATDNSYNVVTGAQNAVLDGFTVTGGGAYSGSGAHGSGLTNTAAGMTISNCTFKNNASTAVWNSGDGLVFRDSVVTNNEAGVISSGKEMTIFHSTFTTNTGRALTLSPTDAGSRVVQCSFVGNVHTGDAGAAMVLSGNSAATVSVSNCEFRDNSALIGGAVYFYAIAAQFDSCVFSGNSATSGTGGAISGYLSSEASVLGFTDCQFTGNSAKTYGGAIGGASLKSLSLDRCTFTGNSAVDYAGAVYLYYGASATVTNSAFFGNTSGSEGGGAFYLYDTASLKLVNTTIARNTSSIGGAVFNRAVSSKLTMFNSIVWQNLPDQISGGTTTASYTINSGNYFAGTGNSGSDPQFVAAATGDLRLKTGSPAINAGLAEGAPTVDLLGVTRDANPDLGCYEGGVSQ